MANWLLDDVQKQPNKAPGSSGNWLLEEPAQSQNFSNSFESGVYAQPEVKDGQLVNNLGKAIGSPIEALAVLNKPLSAFAGGILDLQKQAKGKPNSFDTDFAQTWEAVKKSWESNDKSLVDVVATKEQQEEFPAAYMMLSLVLDSFGDPLQVTKPAKIVGASGAALKKLDSVLGLGDAVSKIVNETRGGQTAKKSIDGILNYEIGGLPMKRWFQEDGVLADEVNKQAARESSLTGRAKEAQAGTKELVRQLIDEGMDPVKAEELVARAVQTRPSVDTQLSPSEIIKAYKEKTLDKLILDGKVDVQDAIDALVAEKNSPAYRIYREENKTKVAEIRAASENTINNLRRDMEAAGTSVDEVDEAIKKVKTSARNEISNVRTLDRVQSIVEASRSGKGTYIKDEFLTPQQQKELSVLRKDKKEALDELRESIDPYGLTISEEPDRIAFREARKPIDAIMNPKMDAVLRNDPRHVPDWETAVRVVVSDSPTPAVRDLFNTRLGNRDVLVTRNPKKADFGKMTTSPTNPRVITVYDDKGNKYSWAGNGKSQGAIEDIISERYGVNIVENATEPMSRDIPTADYQRLFPQEILDMIRYDPEELSRAVKNGEILPQQVVDAVNKAKDSPTIIEQRIAETKERIQEVIDTQNMAIRELESLKADRKITEEAYKERILATKEATKDAISDLALDLKIEKILRPPIIPRIPTKWLDDSKKEQIKSVKEEASARKAEFNSEVDPYGISIDEKLPKQQIREESKRVNAETRKTIDDIMTNRGINREDVLKELDSMNLKPETVTFARQVVSETADIMGDLTNGLLNAGVISESEAIKYFGGSHLRRSYELFDKPEEWLAKLKEIGTPEEYSRAIALFQKGEGARTVGKGAGGTGLDLNTVTKRLTLSKETREKMGEISNSEYLIGKTGQKSIPLLAQAEFFDDVAKRYGVSKEAAKGNINLVQVPETINGKTGKPIYGALAGQYVPKEILQEAALAAGKFDTTPNTLQKAVSWWKVGKLLNPATFARNIQSGFVMANVFGNVPSYAMPKYMTQAFNELRTHGELWKEAMNAGLFHGGITNAELKGITGGQNVVSKGINKAMDVYGKSDDYWRLAVYGYHRANGKGVEEAAKIANRALFDYDKVPPLLDMLRKNGILPFGAFPFFATKETARALYNDPASVAKYLRAEWRNDGSEEKAVMPEYLKGNTLMRLGKGERTVKGNKQEITSFLDMTYLLPFSNDISLGPALGLYKATVEGKDFLNRDLTPPRASTKEVVLDRAKAAVDIVAPTLLTGQYWDKPYRAVTETPDDKGRMYSPKEAAAQSLLGWKTINVNIPEEFKKRMIELDIAKQKAMADKKRLKKSANPDVDEIKQREDQIKSIKTERRNLIEQRQKAQDKRQ